MQDTIIIIISAVVSLLAVTYAHPMILRLARLRDFTDKPDERKLQRRPVPVLGGIAVFVGVVCGLALACVSMDIVKILPVVLMMAVLLCVGAVDDLQGISPLVRIVVEIAAVLVVIYGSGVCIDNFNGLWGINEISWWIAVPLTVFAGVGIINAINMIDGINGLSSGLCIVVCLLFGFTFYHVADVTNAALAFTVAFALMPFFVHNVFGYKSRMFIGDAGTMMLGILITWFMIEYIGVFGIEHNLPNGLCVIANAISILIVPVFDTIRVMTSRIIKGRSPFSADKTHLHHAFIGCGFSHVVTSVSEILLSAVVYLIGYTAYWLDASTDVQLYVVILAGIIFVWGPYFILTKLAEIRGFKYFALQSHYERKGWWLKFEHWLDRKEM